MTPDRSPCVELLEQRWPTAGESKTLANDMETTESTQVTGTKQGPYTLKRGHVGSQLGPLIV